jgi:hypothetical protein
LTSILAVGGDDPVMTNYFPVALTCTTRSWLMNLSVETLTSWRELCRQFTTNFESAYSQVHNTIPRISNASIVVAFHQGVRNENTLAKLSTHDI